jgi:Cof subfamily protein (haloacid dehalogenase superfamily)
MIITDLDKSLLNNEQIISEYTKSVFEMCMKNDALVVFATARPIRFTKIFYSMIKPNAIICHNGAEVLADDKIIYQCSIKSSMAKSLLKKIIENYPKANFAIETGDQIYTNFDASIIWADIISKKIDMKDFPETEIDKIIVKMETVKKIKAIEKYLPDELYLEINEGKLGLIMNKGATKWNAVKELLKYYKIETKAAIAFGDDYNDLEMIKNCGVGIAMENGIAEIKNKAKYICGKNDEE